MFHFLAQTDAEAAVETAVESQNIFIQMLEKGGIPALAIFICFAIFMAYLKQGSKADAADREERKELLSAYEEIVMRFVSLTEKTAISITKMSERMSSCPYKDPVAPVAEDLEVSNDS